MIFSKFAAELWPLIDVDWDWDGYAHLAFLQHEKRRNGAIIRFFDNYSFFRLSKSESLNEPRHEISNNVVYATSKASDQPLHTRSRVRAFACRLNILWGLSY